MTEAFLYYLWKYQLFTAPLICTNGDEVTLIKTGVENTDSGPDFFNARMKIGDAEWAGNVEMHIRASDWDKHGHQKDAAYNNTILHVVLVCDKTIKTKDHQDLKCLELKDKFDTNSLKKYEYFLHNKNWIACENNIKDIPQFEWNNWLERLMIERLESKSAFVEELLSQTNNDWSKAFFISIAGYFGQKINKLPFQILARSIDPKILAKHLDQPIQVESLLFGQAGMLEEETENPYQMKLKQEYEFLRKKYKITPMPMHLWKYMRLRPAAFPDIRIAQFAQLLSHKDFIFSQILEIKKLPQLEKFFTAQASSFWDTHYRFDVLSKKRVKKLGQTSRYGILINSVIPFLFVYGKMKGSQVYMDRAVDLFSQIPAEKNNISQHFYALQKKAHNALESQAMIQLKQNYCDYKKCLNCKVGLYLLK
ncbi:MAG: DUF2851 family protein [Bacteroidales bacterium]|nr:DUF2851 family protein [Bacteroidales bacterium]